MTLLPDWKAILKKAWSVKFIAVAAVLSGLESVAAIAGDSIAKQFPTGLYAAVVGVLTALALVARILAQNEADKADKDEAAQ